MNEYHVKSIRNVAILGHLGCGKTTLVESFLNVSGAIAKKGEVERKNTVSDYTIEEQTRQTSLNATLEAVEWHNYKINFIDVPGSEEMCGELYNALSVVRGAVLIVDASKGVEVGTERCWEELRKRKIPTVVYLSKMDKENVDFDKIVAQIRERLDKRIVATCRPIGQEASFQGIAIVPERRARLFKDGQMTETDLTEEQSAEVDSIYNDLCEVVAGTSEELLDKFFAGEELTLEEIKTGLKTASLAGDAFPLICGSSTKNIGIAALLNKITHYLPAPDEVGSSNAKNPETGESIEIERTDTAPLCAYVFKTIIDPFVGTINFLKIHSGSISTGMDVYIPNTDTTVKMPQIFSMDGKTQIPLDKAFAGDIIAVAKLAELAIGYTICESKKNAVVFDKLEYPTPIYYLAISPKDKKDDDKISPTLQKIAQEDMTFEYRRNPETAQLLIGGQGVLHLGYVIDKLKNSFKVDVNIEDPKVVYRETIRGKTVKDPKGVQGKHKKQSGGAGQYGDVWIRFEPTEEDFVFAEEVVGGAVPKNYFPAVEKGLRQAMEKGPLAGYPVVGVKATLTFGSYHPVDSNEVSFVLAAKLAWENAQKEVRPTILEPICEMNIIVKNDFVGDIMSDMSKRRGRILGQDDIGNGQTCITAEAPEAEIIKYATDLKTMTQASGRFSRSFLRYDIAPEDKVQKIIAESKVE